MIIKFAWRYFKAKKSAHAINIISWVTTAVIAFATCCQVLVLSVFNGFEDLVKSLYVTFYSDVKVVPNQSKTFVLAPEQLQKLHAHPSVEAVSMVVEEKALLVHGEAQTVVNLKGVDTNFTRVSNIAGKISRGEYELGDEDNPQIVMGSGVRQATGITIEALYEYIPTTLILPKHGVASNDPLASMSEGIVKPAGSFSIQQEFDNTIVLTNIDFVRTYTGLKENQYSAAQIQLKKGVKASKALAEIQQITGDNTRVLTRYQQNSSLFQTMSIEKWAIYAILTLILIIAAFNMISALSMLVLEKKRDIAILKSLGASDGLVRRIFLTEGMLLGCIGSFIGIAVASIICFLQWKFHLIPMQGDSFLINYFPVKLVWTDFLLVVVTALSIALMASWVPAYRASKQPMSLR
jgi:lipoprotein-releasing system permease protein